MALSLSMRVKVWSTVEGGEAMLVFQDEEEKGREGRSVPVVAARVEVRRRRTAGRDLKNCIASTDLVLVLVLKLIIILGRGEKLLSCRTGECQRADE